MAEESELIVPIGSWVLLEACRQVATWRNAGLGVERVSVNVSALQLLRADFAGTRATRLSSTKLPPGFLELEVTETSLMDDVGLRRSPAALRELGVRVSVDDFGTGYSSLSYLQRLPVDVLKIDRAFVKDLDASGDAERHARALLTAEDHGLGHSLGLKVLAEGVETKAQARGPALARPRRGPGLLLRARPLDAHAAAEWLRIQSSGRLAIERSARHRDRGLPR
ncbi:MAG: EAL domain-containing protein [Sandaracinaceae bacterium]